MNMTLDSPSNYQQQELENITTPESQSQPTPSPETHGPKSINPNIKGDYWEYYVITVALEKGAEVFRNVCCTGEVDLILRINGQYIPIDVKQNTWNSTIGMF